MINPFRSKKSRRKRRSDAGGRRHQTKCSPTVILLVAGSLLFLLWNLVLLLHLKGLNIARKHRNGLIPVDDTDKYHLDISPPLFWQRIESVVHPPSTSAVPRYTATQDWLDFSVIELSPYYQVFDDYEAAELEKAKQQAKKNQKADSRKSLPSSTDGDGDPGDDEDDHDSSDEDDDDDDDSENKVELDEATASEVEYLWRQFRKQVEQYTFRILANDRVQRRIPSSSITAPSSTIAFVLVNPDDMLLLDELDQKEWQQAMLAVLTANVASLWKVGMGRVVFVSNDAEPLQENLLLVQQKLRYPLEQQSIELDVVKAVEVKKARSGKGSGTMNQLLLGTLLGIQQAKKGILPVEEMVNWLGGKPDRWNYVYICQGDQLLLPQIRPSSLQMISESLDRGDVVTAHRMHPLHLESNFADFIKSNKFLSRTSLSATIKAVDIAGEAQQCCDIPGSYPYRKNIGEHLRCPSGEAEVDTDDNRRYWWECSYSLLQDQLQVDPSILTGYTLLEFRSLFPAPMVEAQGATCQPLVSTEQSCGDVT